MSSFSTEITIQAPPLATWQALADIGNIYRWNPGVARSHLTSSQAAGLGATRHCDLGGPNFLDEKVVNWQPEKQLTMRITNTNMPFKSADIHFMLRADNGRTIVTVSPEYKLKFGWLGALFDRLYVRNTYRQGMEALLDGLKQYVENSLQA